MAPNSTQDKFLEKLGETNFFILLSLGLFITFWFLSNIPVIAEQLLRVIPLDYVLKFKILHPLTSGIGPGKRWFIYQYAGILIGLNFLFLFYLLLHKKKILTKFVACLLIAPLYGVEILHFENSVYEDSLNELSVVNFPNVEFDKIFNKSQVPVEQIKTFDDFTTYAHSVYEKNRKYLSRAWKIENENKLKSLFYLNFVSSLWDFGNIRNNKIPGCVLDNEQAGQIDPSKATVQTYLKSNIGCCTDYAKFLKILLDKENIKNKLVHVRGHIFNEAFFNNKWNVLDASTNAYFHNSWMGITFRKPGESFRVSVFPHHNTNFKNSNLYRKDVGSFRYEMIIAALKRKLFPTYEE